MERPTNNNNNNNNSNNWNCSISKSDDVLRDTNNNKTTPSDFGFQWGNRKRLRCMKVQAKDGSTTPINRVVRRDNNKDTSTTCLNHSTTNGNGNGNFNLRQRPSPPQRVLRNSENCSGAMRGGQSNGGVRVFAASPEKRGTNHHENNNNNNNNNKGGGGVSSDSKKGGGGSSSGSGETGAAPVAAIWPVKFVIGLTNKEKEEDFLAIKGSKLPQRPKKRAKFIQRNLNLVSPGQWLCDLTLERYEVREKKITKKRPRGLKAMNNMESDSE
ncbi:hypothetical protein ACFE04_014497 [Oxalis oulophora]